MVRFNEAAPIVEGNNCNSLGQARLDLGDLFFHALNHLHGILARPHDHNPANHFPTVHVQSAPAKIPADRNLRNVFQVNRNALPGPHGNAPEVVEATDQTDSTNNELHSVLFDDLAPDVDVAASERVHHLAQIDPGLAHFPGVHGHLILPDKASDARDFGHAVNSGKLVTDKEILERAKRPEIESARAGG